MAATDCGVPFAHPPHVFRDAPGTVRACDGDADKREPHECDQTDLIVISDEDGYPDREVCPVCGREFPR